MTHPAAVQRALEEARATGEIDLRGASLEGATLAMVSLRGARLDGADLRGARLRHVELDGASLVGARLDHCHARGVSAVHADFSASHGRKSFWEHCDLTGTSFRAAALEGSMFRLCDLAKADLSDSFLDHAKLVYSCLDRATLDRAALDDAITLASTFQHATMVGTRRFTTCREMVVEILTRNIGDDFMRAAVVGAVALNRGWCYAEWASFLDTEPAYREAALAIFAEYPESGFAEALAERRAG